MSLLSLSIVFLLQITIIFCQTPIPIRPKGYPFLPCSTNPKVVIEAVYDHLCDDSKGNWPTLQALKEAYSSSNSVEILIHIFPLPYHHNAYFVQQAGETVKNISIDSFEKFIVTMFQNQDDFLTGAVDMTEPQVKSSIASLVEKDLDKINKDVIMAGFSDDTIVRKARYAWKYAAHRGITGTPQFIVNGVHYPDGQDYKLEDWKRMINGLLMTQ